MSFLERQKDAEGKLIYTDNELLRTISEDAGRLLNIEHVVGTKGNSTLQDMLGDIRDDVEKAARVLEKIMRTLIALTIIITSALILLIISLMK